MIYLGISSLLIVALLVFYRKSWRHVQECKEDDSDLKESVTGQKNNYDAEIRDGIIYYFDGRPSEAWDFDFDANFNISHQDRPDAPQNRTLLSDSAPQYLASYRKRPLKYRLRNYYRNIIGVFHRKNKNTPK